MSFLAPKAPKAAPIVLPDAPPTIDQASKAAEDSDRLRRRKGRKDYIFGGATNAPVSVGQKTLLGQ
jgi:hypothetical protein